MNETDPHEEKVLKERDDIRKGKIMLIPKRCKHILTITHTNGVIECHDCKVLFVPKHLRGLYPNYLEIKEE